MCLWRQGEANIEGGKELKAQKFNLCIRGSCVVLSRSVCVGGLWHESSKHKYLSKGRKDSKFGAYFFVL